MQSESRRDKVIARWETRGKRYWFEMYMYSNGTYHYSADNGGGVMTKDRDASIAHIEKLAALLKNVDNIKLIRVI